MPSWWTAQFTSLLPFEVLVVAYMALFAVVAPFANVARARRVCTAAIAGSIGVALIVAAPSLPIELRLGLPFLYISLGYWLPVPLVPSNRGGAFEAWLGRTDDAWRSVAIPMPRWLAHIADVGYLFCFPLIPASFAVVWMSGSQAAVVRFWTDVLAAGFVCYGTLPWLISRPPRLLRSGEPGSGAAGATRVNLLVLGTVSHQLNTFPSGHVAVSVAAALSALRVSPAAGTALAIVAAAVTVGAVAGRYHFLADVVAGAALGILVAIA
jgi:membrane-associated phospholipid phosphatase